MVALLAAAFPSRGLVERHTGDTDAGIPVELAASGVLHRELTAAGYVANSGNRYVKTDSPTPQPTIDVLIPSRDGTFRPQIEGGRAYDAVPGLALALHRSLRLQVHALLRNSDELDFQLMVPSVEIAVILKAYSWADRAAQKDVIDLSNLLHIVDHHGADAIGGWRLGDSTLIGARLDAARRLHDLVRVAEAGRLRRGPVDPRKLVVLIRRHVTRP
ncbi:hypothetical protein [Agromyces aerolatus]|uniref:hypothetical protein n=1 Tax=Agromyces sp. LY-1074 TaxID=3074080 RepID=UPI002857A61B|nr:MULTISPECIES: hypothetical protein [unclassified Agromyces]MDR5699417.1 hypothetical protein [Agromyces sp. LY-1074]MDR5705713.1 hypothetical protein [Agromyces sp. LY-1358]